MIPSGLLFQSGFKFDWTISIGNVITGGSFIILALIAWRDLIWRVKNLETWRKEHMIDADARDKLLQNLNTIVGQLNFLVNRILNHEERTGKRWPERD